LRQERITFQKRVVKIHLRVKEKKMVSKGREIKIHQLKRKERN